MRADLRPTDSADQRPLKVLALGDCNTAGAGGGPTIVDQTVQRLQTAGIACEADNWGHTMTTTREGLARTRRDRPFADIVLLNYGLVDSWVTTVPLFYVPYFPETRLRRVARKLLKFTKRRLRSPWVRRWISRGEVVSLFEFDRNLREIIAALRHVNPSVEVVLWATSAVQADPGRNANIDRYNARMESIAAAVGCTFINTSTVLASLPAARSYVDAVHLSGESAEFLGAAVADNLVSRLPPRAHRNSDRTAA